MIYREEWLRVTLYLTFHRIAYLIRLNVPLLRKKTGQIRRLEVNQLFNPVGVYAVGQFAVGLFESAPFDIAEFDIGAPGDRVMFGGGDVMG